MLSIRHDLGLVPEEGGEGGSAIRRRSQRPCQFDMTLPRGASNRPGSKLIAILRYRARRVVTAPRGSVPDHLACFTPCTEEI